MEYLHTITSDTYITKEELTSDATIILGTFTEILVSDACVLKGEEGEGTAIPYFRKNKHIHVTDSRGHFEVY